MRLLGLAVLCLLVAACERNETFVPEEPIYYLVMPETLALWAQEIEAGYLAGCEQLQMPCQVVKHSLDSATELAKFVGELPDSRKAPYAIVFPSPETIPETLDLLSIENKRVITVGSDVSTAYRLGHVGGDAKRLANLVAIRARQQAPERKRILYVLGYAPVDAIALEAAAFQESEGWERYRLRVKPRDEVTEEDFAWCDLAVPIGEDALAMTLEAGVDMVFPTDASALEELREGEFPIILAVNYFDMGFRTSRITREQFLNGRISNPIILSAPRQVDRDSLQLYLDTRYRIPEIKPSIGPTPPAK